MRDDLYSWLAQASNKWDKYVNNYLRQCATYNTNNNKIGGVFEGRGREHCSVKSYASLKISVVKSTQLWNSMAGQEVVTVVFREPKEQVGESLVWRLYMVGRGQIRGSLVCHPEKLIFCS